MGWETALVLAAMAGGMIWLVRFVVKGPDSAAAGEFAKRSAEAAGNTEPETIESKFRQWQIVARSEPRPPARAIGVAELRQARRHLEGAELKYRPPPPVVSEPTREMPARGAIAGDAYEIEYADGFGVVTNRVIRVEQVYRGVETGYVEAFCYLRDDLRTFRTDRIQAMFSHRTGERIADPVAHFEAYYDPPDELVASHTAVLSRARPGLSVLVWIARAEREFDAPIMDLLLDYVEARRLIGAARAAGLGWDREVAARWIRELRPTFDVAAGVLAGLPRAGRVFKQLREFVDRLRATSPGRDRRAGRLFRD